MNNVAKYFLLIAYSMLKSLRLRYVTADTDNWQFVFRCRCVYLTVSSVCITTELYTCKCTITYYKYYTYYYACIIACEFVSVNSDVNLVFTEPVYLVKMTTSNHTNWWCNFKVLWAAVCFLYTSSCYCFREQTHSYFFKFYSRKI